MKIRDLVRALDRSLIAVGDSVSALFLGLLAMALVLGVPAAGFFVIAYFAAWVFTATGRHGVVLAVSFFALLVVAIKYVWPIMWPKISRAADALMSRGV